MFTYNKLQIISAVPLDDIEIYLYDIGASRQESGVYALGKIEISVTPFDIGSIAAFDIVRHKISVKGERSAAEEFLTGFRLRFLCLGG